MTISDVKVRCLELIKTAYPSYTYYSNAVVEKIEERPSFVTQIRPIIMEPVNYNSRNNVVVLTVTYFQKVVDEPDALKVIQTIRDLFGLAVRVRLEDGTRAVKVTEFEYDFIGTERNIPQITITLEWMDVIAHPDDSELMENLTLNEELKIQY